MAETSKFASECNPPIERQKGIDVRGAGEPLQGLTLAQDAGRLCDAVRGLNEIPAHAVRDVLVSATVRRKAGLRQFLVPVERALKAVQDQRIPAIIHVITDPQIALS